MENPVFPRPAVNPIRVLHAAVAEAGIAETGPILPLLDEVDQENRVEIGAAARQLLSQN